MKNWIIRTVFEERVNSGVAIAYAGVSRPAVCVCDTPTDLGILEELCDLL